MFKIVQFNLFNKNTFFIYHIIKIFILSLACLPYTLFYLLIVRFNLNLFKNIKLLVNYEYCEIHKVVRFCYILGFINLEKQTSISIREKKQKE